MKKTTNIHSTNTPATATISSVNRKKYHFSVWSFGEHKKGKKSKIGITILLYFIIENNRTQLPI